MADSSLDDFFAKKDKSKKKSKVKAVEADDGTKPMVKKEKKRDKDKVNSSNSTSNKTQEKRVHDDEWNDFEEEKAVDYSGLKIQTLLVQKEDPEKDGDGEEEEFDEFGEVKERKDGVSGPWHKSSASAAAPVVSKAEEVKPVPVAAPAPASTGKYIPPSQRAGAVAAVASPLGMPNSRRKKAMPNLSSEFDFPTLATGPGADTPTSKDTTTTNPQQRKGVNLALGNKFSVLQD